MSMYVTKYNALILAAALGVFLLPVSDANAACLSYSGRTNLSGLLEQKTFPGPPHYQDTNTGDKPETFWFIKLPKPTCIDADPDKSDLNMAVSSIQEIEVVVNQELYEKNYILVGRNVHITGTLFGAIGLHHHSPVVIDNVQFGPK
jgi:hypothetical protein